MKTTRQLAVILCVALGLASAGSHLLVRQFGVRTGGVGYKFLGGDRSAKPLALAEGSSLMLDALSWDRVAGVLDVGIENWFVAGSSPSEWETLGVRSPDADLTFIVISAYDLNEHFICDYRPEVVPLRRTVADLRESGAGWEFSKRMLSQYPLKYTRVLFPTAGRSDGVMVGVRECLRRGLGRVIDIDSEAGPVVGTGTEAAAKSAKTGSVTEWSESRRLRRLTLMRTSCGGQFRFDGPKQLALLRMLREARRKGRAIVVVLPVSPFFAEEFLSPGVENLFEELILEARREVPEAEWVRLDHVTDLQDNRRFADLVHMNVHGRRLATDAFLDHIDPALGAR